LHEFRLGPRHALDSTDMLRMSITDSCHHADRRLPDTAQPGDLAEMVHPHLQDQHLGIVGGVEDRARQTLVVVERLLIRRGSPAFSEHCLGEVLGTGFTDGAGDTNDPVWQSSACPPGKLEECLRRISDLDRRASVSIAAGAVNW